MTTITTWKDGTTKIWRDTDAHYAANDEDWLKNTPLISMSKEELVTALEQCAEGMEQKNRDIAVMGELMLIGQQARLQKPKSIFSRLFGG